jgi:hypothetical protein
MGDDGRRKKHDGALKTCFTSSVFLVQSMMAHLKSAKLFHLSASFVAPVKISPMVDEMDAPLEKLREKSLTSRRQLVVGWRETQDVAWLLLWNSFLMEELLRMGQGDVKVHAPLLSSWSFQYLLSTFQFEDSAHTTPSEWEWGGQNALQSTEKEQQEGLHHLPTMGVFTSSINQLINWSRGKEKVKEHFVSMKWKKEEEMSLPARNSWRDEELVREPSKRKETENGWTYSSVSLY